MKKLSKDLDVEDSDEVEDLSMENDEAKEKNEKVQDILKKVEKSLDMYDTDNEGSGDDENESSTTEAPNAGSTLIGSLVLFIMSLLIIYWLL